MKKIIKNMLIVMIIFIIIITTNSYANSIEKYRLNKETLKANIISGVCKTYSSDDVYYYRKNTDGTYNNVSKDELATIRNSIKQAIDSAGNGKYIVSKILKSDTYYDATNKEFCFRRNVASVSSDTLVKVILVGYDDNYEFKSNLSSSKGAYIAKKIGETESFYVAYEDSWVENELSEMCDATSIRLNKTSLELKVGETAEVTYEVLPEEALSKTVTVAYTTNIEINTDTHGVVKIVAIEKGTGNITVKLKSNNDINATCDIKVVSDEVEPTPTPIPTAIPTLTPTPIPTQVPTSIPTQVPTQTPTSIPTATPTPTNEKITSNKYDIDSNKKYISQISPNVKIDDFKSNIDSKGIQYEILNKDGSKITDSNTKIATGMKLKIQNEEHVLIVRGDINGDGEIKVGDVVKSNLYSISIAMPSDIEKVAADINKDGKISVADIVQIKLATIGLKLL